MIRRTQRFRQIGTSNITRDKWTKAKEPGRRRSAAGNIYYEYRKNRTDIRRTRV